MRIFSVLLVAFLSLLPVGSALACADPLKATFRELVTTAPTIFTFQVTSAFYIRKPLGGQAWTEYVVGNIRVIDTLKGDASPFKLIKYSFRSCGSTRMSVGQFYIATTSQTGPTLELWGTNQAILDLTLDFYNEKYKRSPGVDVVKRIIAGAPIPPGFPGDHLESLLEVYPLPPAPAK